METGKLIGRGTDFLKRDYTTNPAIMGLNWVVKKSPAMYWSVVKHYLKAFPKIESANTHLKRKPFWAGSLVQTRLKDR